MKINYNLANENFSYKNVENEEEIKKLNFLLTNNKGDYLNLGIDKNSCKYNGLNICRSEDMKIFKILDEMILENVKCMDISYNGFKIFKKYSSNLSSNLEVLDENKINDNSLQNDKNLCNDSYYLGPTGGVVYEISNYEGLISFDFDMRELNDFDEWGREYNVYIENGIIIIEFTKKKGDLEEYKLYAGIKTPNILYEIKNQWVEKEYEYSKKRNSLYKRYVFRAFNLIINDHKKIIISSGFSKEEIFKQINLLEHHQKELEKFDENFVNDFMEQVKLKEVPMPLDYSLSYKLSINAIYKFLNKDLLKSNFEGSYAGLPWFSQVWVRDELYSLRSFINLEYNTYVKKKLFDYIQNLDENTGKLKRLFVEESLESFDGVFWLAKRFEDFIYHLEKKGEFDKNLNLGELKFAYDKFHNSFKKIIENSWDKDNELIKVDYGDSWMDTIQRDYPLEIQVQFLEFVSVLAQLATLIGKKADAEKYLDFENLFRQKIRDSFWRNEMLYDEKDENKISSNIFLAYYLYPDLFLREDWEKIVDKSLIHLKTNWGGLSSLSNRDSRFKEEYTGENNLSYHHGDSWFWINNISAIVLMDLNEKKYRKEINQIMISSSKDILRMGTIGFASEISSSKEQRAEGCMAQLWSSASYIEMIDKMYK